MWVAIHSCPDILSLPKMLYREITKIIWSCMQRQSTLQSEFSTREILSSCKKNVIKVVFCTPVYCSWVAQHFQHWSEDADHWGGGVTWYYSDAQMDVATGVLLLSSDLLPILLSTGDQKTFRPLIWQRQCCKALVGWLVTTGSPTILHMM